MENETIVFNVVEPESNHPVLTNLKKKIAELEEQNKSLREDLDKSLSRVMTLVNNTKEEKERIETVFIEALELHDTDTITYLASQLDISLLVKKRFEVNVTFTLDFELKPGVEVDPEWDLDFTVRHNDLIDYYSDVVYSNEIDS
jgi:aspartokinase